MADNTNTNTNTNANVSSTTNNVSDSGAKTSVYLQSPNAIPPRTSSTGYAVLTPPAKSVLRPVPESNWLSQNIHTHRKSRSTSFSPLSSAGAMGFPGSPGSPGSPGFQDPARYATEDFDYAARRTWTQDKEDAVRAPYDYLLGHPGKDIRTSLISAFNAWLAVPKERLDVIANIVAMLHTSSLLVDDVEDNSTLRRGVPVAHSIFGTARTINSANYIYFCALQELQKLSNPRAVAIFSEELANLHRGQGMDLHWRDSLQCPTEDLYLEMVGNKTGGLFRLAVKLMQAESPASSATAAAGAVVDCVPLVNILGIIFQIQDDYRNLWSPEYGENKGFCEDLTEGKFSFPIVHSIRADPRDDARLLNILRQRTADVEVKRYAVKCIEATGSFDYTRKVLAVLVARARRAADDLAAGDPAKSAPIHRILDKLAV
ncbi:putative geranylgeranyl pyrophosphate synthase [Rosellinia necatrix]|uniref:Putative geranylgeranyl pyrophosphate synthase n=1 Tax=Rosellinia necatrix TaxID=77044 RepID=A0A1W2TW61_ROSNE|nr:putative geranylgeranyl pyrophosphate synthase [Rosellinia necatrix]